MKDRLAERLEKLIKERETEKARKEEKSRLKKEKEEEKKREKKLEHKKKLQSKRNKRAYNKRRKVELARRENIGDEYGYFSVYITKNRRKVRFIGTSWWKSDAYEIFNNAIEGNQKNVQFPQTVFTQSKQTTPIKYEIVLVKKTNGEEDTVASFRDENGKYVDNVIVDWEDHVIIDKHDWLVEETFAIYGYHPKKDRKKYSFILNDLLLNNEDIGDEMRRIMVYKNKLIIQYLDNFDFVTCFDTDQCKKLYDKLQTDVMALGKKYIVFMGELASGLVSEWIDKFEEKTGWKRDVMWHSKTV